MCEETLYYGLSAASVYAPTQQQLKIADRVFDHKSGDINKVYACMIVKRNVTSVKLIITALLGILQMCPSLSPQILTGVYIVSKVPLKNVRQKITNMISCELSSF